MECAGFQVVQSASDDYTTIKALRRCVALLSSGNNKLSQMRDDELSRLLLNEVSQLNETLRLFSGFQTNPSIKRNVSFMKQLRSGLGDVFFYSFCVANSLNVDISKAIFEKIKENERKLAGGLKK